MNFKNKIKITVATSLALVVMWAANASAAEKLNLNLTYDGATHNYSAEPVNLVVNNKSVQCKEMPPIILNGSTMVPAREVFEELGATVDWNPEQFEVLIGYESNLAILKVDSEWANVNGTNIYMSTKAKIINGKTMIPMRFGAESLGLKVDWDAATRTASVTADQFQGYDPTDETQIPPGIPISADGSPIPPSNEIEPDATITSYILEQLNTHYDDNSFQLTTPGATSTVTHSSDVIAKARDISISNIKSESHPTTKITDVILPGNDSNTYRITASSPISSVEKNLLEDNRIVLDIHNAEMATPQSEYTVTGRAVSKIRTGQFQLTPEKIARVVLDLGTAAEYSVKLSEDRKTLSVEFGKNGITDVRLKTEGLFDYIYIDFKHSPNISVTPLMSPERLLIDAPYSDIDKIASQSENGKFVNHMETDMKDAFNAQIILSLNAQVQYSIETMGNQVIIKLFEPTYKNIFYDTATRVIRLKKPLVDSNAFTHTDNYENLEYTIGLGGDFASYIGYGEYFIRDSLIDSITIRNNAAGMTELLISERQILAYMVSEDNDYIYIKPVNPKEKYPFVLLLDAGHGGKDPGAHYFDIYEKSINLDIVLRLAKLLESDPSFKVYLTRSSDTYPTLEGRVVMANYLSDLFVSVHNNSAGSNSAANGTEVYYHPHGNDSSIGITTSQVAKIMLKSITAATGSIDRSVREEGYYVIKYTKIPSVLCEIGFLSNQQEAAKLNSADYRQKAAQGLYQGLLEIRRIYSPRG